MKQSVNKKSLMAEWLDQASQCHDLEVMSSNPD